MIMPFPIKAYANMITIELNCVAIMKVVVVLGLAALAIASVSAKSTGIHQQVHPKDQPKEKINGRIVNGYPAYEGKAPYAVGLGFADGWWCGGSIIANDWVVTAAHCTNGASAVTIYYGATWRTEAVFTHWVGSGDFIQNSNWPNENGNDIALIRTPHVDFWSNVNKVELPSFNDRYNMYDGWWTVACGWGLTTEGSLPDWLQCVDLQIISNSQCAQTYGSIPDGILCVNTEGGKSTCSGDSGGPLVLHDGGKLAGITSFGAGDGCVAGLPAGFTRVTHQLEWIRDHSGVAYY